MIARMGGDNAFGFTTTLSEVNITIEDRHSGGPLFNGEYDSVGVLHGGNKKYSYYIGLAEIKTTLTVWGETHANFFISIVLSYKFMIHLFIRL